MSTKVEELNAMMIVRYKFYCLSPSVVKQKDAGRSSYIIFTLTYEKWQESWVSFHDICIAEKDSFFFPGKEPGYGEGTVIKIKCHLRVTNRRSKTVRNRLKYRLKIAKVDNSFCECGYLVFFVNILNIYHVKLLWRILFTWNELTCVK